jgi:hypothetical protein
MYQSPSLCHSERSVESRPAFNPPKKLGLHSTLLKNYAPASASMQLAVHTIPMSQPPSLSSVIARSAPLQSPSFYTAAAIGCVDNAPFLIVILSEAKNLGLHPTQQNHIPSNHSVGRVSNAPFLIVILSEAKNLGLHSTQQNHIHTNTGHHQGTSQRNDRGRRRGSWGSFYKNKLRPIQC